MEEPIFEGEYILKKFSGKGAWTFVLMPLIPGLPKKKNGTLRVRGFIDDYELKDFNMWSMKAGNFIAVKAAIRKQIKKEEGDTVKVILYLDEAKSVIPEDFLTCLNEEPNLLKHFNSYPETRKKEITDWIFGAKTEDEKITRIAQTLEKLETESASK
ncbi:MAG TPA: YdeI/OmpD-associated family protein [Flavobacterium sp.]|nr:YdeI/OmpD-associated family protein [Flavobacterium sp.]